VPVPSRTKRGRSRGQSMVEFVLVLPIMLILLAAAIDLGRLFYAYVAVENAAKEGAFYGARSPLCSSSANASCADPNNVVWHVENEAPNIGDQFSTTVACRTPAGALVQPINDCLDGYTYQVTVTYPFKLITPILGSIVNQNLTLGSTSQATVISDAFDPSGLELLIWVDNTGADNAVDIASACSQAEAATSPNFYFAPCQDSTNVDNYLKFLEGTSVNYKVRVRNTGNLALTGIRYAWQENGSNIASQGNCATLPTAIGVGAAPSYCAFSRSAVASNPVDGIATHVISGTAQGTAQSLPTGLSNGSAATNVVPAAKLSVTLRAAQYRLGGTGNGLLGNAQYANGNMTLNRNATSPLPEIQTPTAWFQLTVVNQGGTADNFTVTVTQQGSQISIPCTPPATLAPGDAFVCIFPRTLTATQAYAFSATASATGSLLVGGTQRNVTVTTATCSASQRVIPNLVDTLTPSADGSNKTVGQAKSTWTAAGLTSTPATTPPGATNGQSAITQNRLAYTCMNANTSVNIGAQ
jgi:Flp pilus assembly protein TadG